MPSAKNKISIGIVFFAIFLFWLVLVNSFGERFDNEVIGVISGGAVAAIGISGGIMIFQALKGMIRSLIGGVRSSDSRSSSERD